MFKDKKLNKLWEKAELAGFTPEELRTLKEEFEHHQDKIDVYYNLLENVDVMDGKSDHHENSVIEEDEQISFNEIMQGEDNNESNDIKQSKQDLYVSKANKLRDTHRNIRDNFDRMERIVAKGPNSQDFIEPKVQGLWRVALSSDFSPDELASLKVNAS